MNEKRSIEGLRWAVLRAKRPEGLPRRRATVRQKLGIAYERAVVRSLGGDAIHGQWIEYEDRNGRGYAQVDLLLKPYVFEVKYTWTADAAESLEGLYLPLMRSIWRCAPPRGIVICKNLTPQTPRGALAVSFEDALEADGNWGIPILQWSGIAPLRGPQRGLGAVAHGLMF